MAANFSLKNDFWDECCFAFLLCFSCWLAFIGISWSDGSCPDLIIKVDEDESVQDGEDNLEREANQISDKQSSTEAESDSDSVLCTLSTVIRICNLMPIMHSLL